MSTKLRKRRWRLKFEKFKKLSKTPKFDFGDGKPLSIKHFRRMFKSFKVRKVCIVPNDYDYEPTFGSDGRAEKS